MRTTFFGAAVAAIVSLGFGSSVEAATHLSEYVDANGFLDVQKLTCAQLANTYQGDADMLTTWYSGWYNGLAKKHYLDFVKGKEVEHQVILYCEAHQDLLIIDAIAEITKIDRKLLGITTP